MGFLEARAPDAAQRAVLHGVVRCRAGAVQKYVFVMRGLDPRIHPLRKNLSKKMDGRVKPGHDGPVFGTVPALRSSVKNAAARPGHGTVYNLSTIVTLAMPPPSHMVCKP
jgi:hypothetical protein